MLDERKNNNVQEKEEFLGSFIYVAVGLLDLDSDPRPFWIRL